VRKKRFLLIHTKNRTKRFAEVFAIKSNQEKSGWISRVQTVFKIQIKIDLDNIYSLTKIIMKKIAS
jgi:hypothetical protein